jgi:hypothetical protein
MNELTRFLLQAIPKEGLKKCDCGRLPENFPKNRYKNTIACKINNSANLYS